VDDRQAAFRAYLSQLGVRGPSGESLTAEQVAELIHSLTAARATRPVDADITGNPMFAAAVGFHEFFKVLTAAGFTEDQALRYLAYASQQSGGSGQ
jgi:hypothetical protein